MDNLINKTFEDSINNNLISIIISNSTNKEKLSKVKIRPVLLKGALLYQVSEYIGNQIFHKNYQKQDLMDQLPEWFEELFHQVEIISQTENITILISKKGKVTVKNKKIKIETEKTSPTEKITDSEGKVLQLSHNKKKNYILQEDIPLPFLIDLGVMSKEGKIINAKSDKFKQINRFLEFIEDILPYLEKEKELTILDFGCGKSYLTFAMYYYLRILKGFRINVIGLDLKTEVIKKCNELSEKYGYDKLHFYVGDIASYQGSGSVDMVVTLHACDTATDYALYKAVSWGAQVILSVPCCQHELNRQIRSDILKPVLKYGIVQERMAALITDALRAELLESQGYRVQLLEFIDMEHTPKNILIRAVKRDRSGKKSEEKDAELKKCMEFLNVSPCLLNLLSNKEE